jgi:hypothetical protein
VGEVVAMSVNESEILVMMVEVTTSGSWLIAFSASLLTCVCHMHAIGRYFYPNYLGR